MATKHILLTGLALALMAGCSRKEEILEGPRYDIRTPLAEVTMDGPGEVAAAETAPKPVKISLPKQVTQASWTHTNGGTRHVIQHPALSAAPVPVFAVPIGQGNSSRHRITATPVAGDGRIFTLDSRALVAAHDLSGNPLWSYDMTPATDAPDDASGGGLALDGNTLYVTSAFGRLFALDAKTGAVRWEQKLDAPVTAAPTVSGGLVYVVSRDSRAWAIDAKDGRIRWSMPGAPVQASVQGGAGPALTDRLVILPFGSTEVLGVLKKNGLRVWGAAVSGERLGRAYAGFTDISGDPVIVGNTIYTGTPSGRVVALDAVTGERKWTAREGTVGPVWPVGGSLFLISDEARLIRLNASTGETIWAQELPYFKRPKPKKRKDIHTHFGPILAGGKLWVASDDDQLRGFDPASGALLTSVPLPKGAATAPIVVNQTLYVVSADGKLHAFR